MSTEAEIRQWVRDEQDKILSERQDACPHNQAGQLQTDGAILCVICLAPLTHWPYPDDFKPLAPEPVEAEEVS